MEYKQILKEYSYRDVQQALHGMSFGIEDFGTEYEVCAVCVTVEFCEGKYYCVCMYHC